MTRTEDRLADALGAGAELIRQESLRPLVPPAIERHRPAGRVWLAASAAAVAVLAVVAGAAAIANRTPVTGPASASAVPSYRVEVDKFQDVVVHSVATGQVTDTLAAALGAKGFSGTTVASASRASVFAVAYVASGHLFNIDEFGLTKTGRINHLRQVGKVRDILNVSLAMSPDGSKIAFAGLALRGRTSDHPVIEVFDREAGSHSIWTSGTDSAHSQLAIAALSWQASGRSLIYQGDWCMPYEPAEVNGYCFIAAGKSAKAPFIKQLTVAGSRGLLPGGKIGGKLLRTFGSVGKAQSLKVIADPADSRAVLFMEQRNSRVLIYKVKAQGKFDPQLLFRSKAESALRQGDSASFYADGSGSYLLVNVNRGALYGWVHAGKFHGLDAKKVDWQSGAW
jgi:hypothetical protein